MEVDQGFHDGESEAAACLTALLRVATPIELVEDDVAFGLWHAGAIVGHRQRHVPVDARRGDLYHAPTRRVLGRIGQQIGDDLFDSPSIAMNVARTDDSPALINGNGTPITGNIPSAMPMLMKS